LSKIFKIDLSVLFLGEYEYSILNVEGKKVGQETINI